MSNRATLLRGVDFSFFFEGFVLLLKWFPPQRGDSSTPTLQQMKEYLLFTPSSWVDFYISTFYPSHNQTNHNWITCKNLFLFFKWRVSSSFVACLLSLCSVIYTHNHHSFPCWSWMEANRQEYMLPSLMVVGVNPLHHLSSLYNAVCWVRRW